ncbi:MAG TPA: hypothetical protein VGI39_44565 [Polyangiaceae bacterium]|jgi:hypothetical protein
MAARSLAAGVLVLGCVLGACTGKDPYQPGTQLGTFTVDATVQTNDCGIDPGASPWVFTVKIGVEPGTLYWEQGSLPVAGKFSAAHVATLNSTSTLAVPGAGLDAGAAACVMERDDALSATFVPDPTLAGNYESFSGTLAYTFKEAAGSADCSGQLSANGGQYAKLPCTMAFGISATRTALPNQYGK